MSSKHFPLRSRYFILWFWVVCLLPLACSTANPLTPPSVKPGVYGKLYKPISPGLSPAIVMLHGNRGPIHGEYYDFAKTLADHGYIALVLDYYAETGRVENFRKVWPLWQRTVQNSVQYLQGLPDVQAESIGVVGYSLGAFLAISTAARTPAIKAVVDYYGGGTRRLEQYARQLPPVLILHGEKDSEVPVANAKTLYATLTRHGKTVEMHIYPGVEHAFNLGDGPDNYYTVDARKRAITFLDKYLKPPQR